jgi:hypothetical protein
MPKNLCAPEVGGKAMPRIERYRFGHVVVDGEEQTRDVVVLPDRVLASWWRADGHKLVLADLDDVIEELPERLVVGTGAFRRMRPERETLAELRRQLDDDRLWAADLAEPIYVCVALHLANEFPSVGSQASDDGVDVVDGKGDMADARRVRRRLPVAARARRSMKLHQLEPSVAVRGLHHRELRPDALEPHHAVHPTALDRPLADRGDALAVSGGSANAILFPSGSGTFTWRTPFE